jgi:dihydrofolate reductase
MPKLRVHNFTISLDGYAAGLGQTLERPFGAVPDPGLHEWMFATRFGREMMGEDGGGEGVDNDYAVAGDVGIGATIMGRNMFGPIRGAWGDDEWKGWWGDEPPYHHPVFVLTHHPRAPIPMEGGTTFHFVDDGIQSALAQAVDAAGGEDVRIGGGAATIQQYLRAGLIDDLHLVISPLLIGAGERLFDRVDDLPVGYKCVELVSSPAAVHAHVTRIDS